MQQHRLYPFLLCLTAAVFYLAGCKKPDFESRERTSSTLQNVGDYINNNFDLSLFASAIKKAGLLDTLNNPGGTFTVFAPTNEAFNADSIYSPSDFDKFSLDTLKYIVRTHILPQKVFYTDVPDNMDNLYSNLNGVNLYISAFSSVNQGNVLDVDGIPVNPQNTGLTPTFDISQANGVVHTMPTVIRANSGTIQDVLAARPDMTDFVAAMKHFGLWDSLEMNPLTMFAVNNAGMESRGLTLDSIQHMDTTQYNQILFSGYIQYPHHLFTADLALISAFNNAAGNYTYDETAYFPSANGDIVAFSASYQGNGISLESPKGAYLGPIYSPYGYLEYAPFTPKGSNYACSNGVLHIVSDILILPGAAHK